MTFSQGSLFIFQFGGSVILARLLTPYEMGVYAVAMAITGVLSAIQAFGLVGFVVREHEMTEDLLASAFTINAALALVLSAAVFGLSTFGGQFLREAGVQSVMRILALLPLVGIVEFLPAANVEREGRFKSIALITVVRTVAVTCCTVSLAFAGFSYMSLAYGTLAGAIVSAASFSIVGRRHVRLRLSIAEWQRITRFGVQMLAISGITTISTRTAEFVLGRLLGLGALGLYSRASNLNNLLWDNVHMVIGRVVFVDFAEQKRRGFSLRDHYLRTVEIVTALLWPAFAGFATLAGPLILTVYGPKWIGAARPLAMLSLAAIVLVAITMTWEVFVVCEKTGQQARFEFIRATVGLFLFLGGSFVSLTAAAAAKIGEALFSVVLYRPHLDRMTDTRTADIVPLYLRSAGLTALAVGPSVSVMTLYHWSVQTPLSYLFSAVGIGVVAWFVGLKLMNHPIFDEIAQRLPSRKRAGADTAV
ncbi:MAG: oligosaccharide flippase family protein [Pseudomonadota bacterium]|nr:oligosaccharide flippase family protein [Pseudomonadota bacterium]